jgi:hypothetical protein
VVAAHRERTERGSRPLLYPLLGLEARQAHPLRVPFSATSCGCSNTSGTGSGLSIWC